MPLHLFSTHTNVDADHEVGSEQLQVRLQQIVQQRRGTEHVWNAEIVPHMLMIRRMRKGHFR